MELTSYSCWKCTKFEAGIDVSMSERGNVTPLCGIGIETSGGFFV